MIDDDDAAFCLLYVLLRNAFTFTNLFSFEGWDGGVGRKRMDGIDVGMSGILYRRCISAVRANVSSRLVGCIKGDEK